MILPTAKFQLAHYISETAWRQDQSQLVQLYWTLVYTNNIKKT